MALAFNESQGGAASKKVDSYQYKDGLNTVRMVGGILPRYVYWVKGTNNKDIPIECLSFNREKERFDNVETDHVPTFFPEAKCSWAYSIQCIDPTDGKVKVLNLKKKLFAQIRDAAADLGDPTDPDTGWAVVFNRVKDGPAAFNVAYNLAVLKCKPSALTEEERAAVAAAKPIDELYPRSTPEEILALLNKIRAGSTADGDDTPAGTDAEAVSELG